MVMSAVRQSGSNVRINPNRLIKMPALAKNTTAATKEHTGKLQRGCCNQSACMRNDGTELCGRFFGMAAEFTHGIQFGRGVL